MREQIAIVIKNPPASARDIMRREFSSWVRKIPWKRAWHPTPVFFPRESHGQKSLAGYSPWGCKESDTTEQLSFIHSFPGCVSGKEPACQCGRHKKHGFDP